MGVLFIVACATPTCCNMAWKTEDALLLRFTADALLRAHLNVLWRT